jgi:hypothetical protein
MSQLLAQLEQPLPLHDALLGMHACTSVPSLATSSVHSSVAPQSALERQFFAQ